MVTNHQPIIGNHHFAHASSEALDLYRDHYFLSCVMVTHSVAEGILKFVAERNNVAARARESRQALAERLRDDGFISPTFCGAFVQIWSSYRNDYHHMNPSVSAVDHAELAERNIENLATMEREIFECGCSEGKLVPRHEIYWDLQSDGSVPVSICGSDRRLRVPGYSQKERAYWLVLPVFNGQSLHPRKLAHIVTDHRETIGQRNCRNLHVVRPDSRSRLFQLRALFAVDYCSRIVKWHAVEFCHELAKQGEVLT